MKANFRVFALWAIVLCGMMGGNCFAQSYINTTVQTVVSSLISYSMSLITDGSYVFATQSFDNVPENDCGEKITNFYKIEEKIDHEGNIKLEEVYVGRQRIKCGIEIEPFRDSYDRKEVMHENINVKPAYVRCVPWATGTCSVGVMTCGDWGVSCN